MNSPLSVIKYGGNAIEDHRLLPQFAQAIAQLRQQGHRIVIVHGGGPQINYWLDKTNITSHFIDGQRVTDTDTLEIVEMALCAQVNKALVRACLSQGLNAVGISGQDAHLIRAKRQPKLQHVGSIEDIQPALIHHLLEHHYLPIIAPIGLDNNQQMLNINADFSAAHIACALNAQHFILMTNVDGLLDKQKQRIKSLHLNQIDALMTNGTISGGMIPKIRCASLAAQNGARVHILNGTQPHNLLTAYSNPEQLGTQILNP